MAVRPASDLLLSARECERAGKIGDAIEQYEVAIAVTERSGECRVLAEALRRLAVVRHQHGERDAARDTCHRSYEVARNSGNPLLAAEALNSLGGMLIREGMLNDAREMFDAALTMGGANADLRARVERNLGVVANIRGDLDDALDHYRRSLGECQSIGDEHGAAMCYHNLGIVCRHKHLLDDAERYFQLSLDFGDRSGDVRWRAFCLLNRADVYLERQRFEDARRDAETALATFDQLNAQADKAVAYRVIGVVYRDTGRAALAESRLRASIDLASAAGSILHEAEATRALALVYQQMGRNQEALGLLNAAHALFGRLDAKVDLVNVGGLMDTLEGTYLDVVREWGQSIESSDSYTFGHCERVADLSVAVARELGFDESEQTTVRLGAYLHDVGKVKVPHEILNKPGPLTADEFEVIKMHPVWGIELLAKVEFPWDIKPIIRWHHEKYDGAGYPDQLKGDDIPLAAQIVGIVDVFDALTTTRSYRSAMPTEKALEIMTSKMSNSWSPAVFEAFIRVQHRDQQVQDSQRVTQKAA